MKNDSNAVDVHTAGIKVFHAARYLAMASARDMDSKNDNVWLGLGVNSLIEAANALGYVMVRTRQPKATSDTEAA